MKTFINVLYRRILYKVPLKWLLILIAIFWLLFASFSSADLLGAVWEQTQNWTHTFVNNDWEFICVRATHSNCNINPAPSNWDTTMYAWALYCFDWTFTITCNSQYTYWESFTIPKFTSLQCQTEYSLIPISSVDQNYCTSNNLCPSSDCPSYSWDLTLWVSNVWINDLFHPWAYNIVMNIADEIDRDYAYTNSWQNLNIDVVWYNVDYEAMQSVIDQQNYKPTQEDFNNLIAVLWPYSKIIIFFVFLFIVWAWIKKPFKSKKL